MKCLGFESLPERDRHRSRDRRIRTATFQVRSGLPISAGCVVANGVRETLSSLLGAPVGMRLFEPCIPSPQAWATLLRDARLYRVRGAVADAVVVLRAADAAALAAMLFGEGESAESKRRLSPLECDVLDRLVNAFAASLGTVCGSRESHLVERVAAIAGFVTYFELLVTEPIAARIGIALSRDPSPQGSPALGIAHLSGIRITACASLDLGSTNVAAVARLKPGDVIPLSLPGLQRCEMLAGSRGILRGTCGIRNGRYSVAVDARA